MQDCHLPCNDCAEYNQAILVFLHWSFPMIKIYPVQ